jgi:hypothetical protein
MSGWLIDEPTVVVLLVLSALFGMVVLVAMLIARRLPTHPTHSVAAPLMPALGAAFGVLVAITIANEAVNYRAAQDGVVAEAATGARLAWASTNKAIDTTAVQDALLAYVDATRVDGWAALGRGQSGSAVARDRLADLQRLVHQQAAVTGLGSAQASELLTSVDDLSRLRRTRIDVAGRGLDNLYLFVILLSGAALIVNAILLTVGQRRVLVAVPAGLVLVVVAAVSLAVGLGAPFRGGLEVSRAPLTTLAADLRTGYFSA